MQLLDILVKGGYLMIPIYLASIVALYIFVERILALRKVQINTRTFVLQVRNLLLRNEMEDAIVLCKKTAGPISRMTRIGIENLNRPRLEIKEAIDSVGKAEIYNLEKNLGALGTIASVAPMLGFFGTVTGMITAFMQIQSHGGNVDASVLAGGIWEALLTTAAGLAVGIISLIAYNYVQGKIEKIVFEMEEVSTELMSSILNETGAGRREFANQ